MADVMGIPRSEPESGLRPIHNVVNHLLQHDYGLPISQANHIVIAFRTQIAGEQRYGHTAEEIAQILYRLLRYRGDL